MPDYDVVVTGGGAAGIGAAVGAARAGARVLLAERHGFLGGAATNAGVLTYCGLYVNRPEPVRAVGGVGAEVMARLARRGGQVAPFRARSGNWIVMFDPEALKLVLDEVLEDAGVTSLLHARVTGAEAENGVLRHVRITDHAGDRIVVAGAFADTSGEGTLAALAGVRSAVDSVRGDHVQPASYPFRVGGVEGDGPLDRAPFAAAAAAVAASEGAGVRADGGVIIRQTTNPEIWWMAVDLATDGLTAESLSAAERRGRHLAAALVAALRRQPGMERAYLIGTGPQLGIRETRRPAARLILTQQDGREGRRSPEGVARAAWPMEVHLAPGKSVFEDVGGEGFFDVPLDALRPVGIGNLWLGGRVIGADDAAYGSVRVMGTGFATGQAAGVAAALGARGGSPSAAAVREALAGQGGIV
ncbi:FAD-dependent oxidoreductase [Muricoccus radiodurans]|uniref:FAD-dependent oxidoreductase n=1 Tax=Muricoccus radiodurans TaxID=2231721 RepID=UPI003CF52ABB